MSPTPRDDPSLLSKWRELERDYRAQGMSRYTAVKAIAQEYKTSIATVYRWLGLEKEAERATPLDKAWI